MEKDDKYDMFLNRKSVFWLFFFTLTLFLLSVGHLHWLNKWSELILSRNWSNPYNFLTLSMLVYSPAILSGGENSTAGWLLGWAHQEFTGGGIFQSRWGRRSWSGERAVSQGGREESLEEVSVYVKGIGDLLQEILKGSRLPHPHRPQPAGMQMYQCSNRVKIPLLFSPSTNSSADSKTIRVVPRFKFGFNEITDKIIVVAFAISVDKMLWNRKSVWSNVNHVSEERSINWRLDPFVLRLLPSYLRSSSSQTFDPQTNLYCCSFSVALFGKGWCQHVRIVVDYSPCELVSMFCGDTHLLVSFAHRLTKESAGEKSLKLQRNSDLS